MNYIFGDDLKARGIPLERFHVATGFELMHIFLYSLTFLCDYVVRFGTVTFKVASESNV